MKKTLPIIVLMFLCAHTPIFAKGGRGGDCVESCTRDGVCGSSGCGNSSSDAREGSGDRGNGGTNSESNSAASSSNQSNQNRPVWAAVQDVRGAECYVAPNGQICTKAQLIAAAKELTIITAGLAQGKKDVVVGSVTRDIALRLFGIDTAPLGCAVATPAPAELCITAARIEQLEKEAKAIEKAINDEGDELEREFNNIKIGACTML